MIGLRSRYETWRTDTYQKWAPAMVAFSLITACCASIGVLWLTKVQGDEQDKRAEDIAGLQGCFDTYARLSSSTSKAVRDASVEVSEATTDVSRATTARDVALDDVFNYIATDPAEDDPKGARLFATLLGTNAALVDTQAELVVAQADLAHVRTENPVPDPPSTFCEVQP